VTEAHKVRLGKLRVRSRWSVGWPACSHGATRLRSEWLLRIDSPNFRVAGHTTALPIGERRLRLPTTPEAILRPMILEQGPLDQKTCRFDHSVTTCQCERSWLDCDGDSRSCFDGASAIKTAPMITRTATPISSPRATMLRNA
jgi:hypothetical protein